MLRFFRVPFRALVRLYQAVPRNLLRISLWAAIFSASVMAQSALTGRVLAIPE
jgi:hypothetical protein